MKPTVVIHTNDKQMLGALVSAHSFRRNSRAADSFDVDVRLSMLPPSEISGSVEIPKAAPAPVSQDPFGNVVPASGMGAKAKRMSVLERVAGIGETGNRGPCPLRVTDRGDPQSSDRASPVRRPTPGHRGRGYRTTRSVARMPRASWSATVQISL